MKIAFLGLGSMGRGICRNLLKKKHILHVWNRSAEKTALVAAWGGIPFGTPAKAAEGVDAVFVCLGAPKQELWMARNGSATNARLLCGLGGSLDVFAGTVKRAPRFWSDHGLEWFYRLCKEPRRIGRMMKLPLFLVHVQQEKRRK